MTPLAVEHLDAAGLRARRAEVLSLYRDVHAGRPDEPFRRPARFWERLDANAGRDGFGMVTGRVGAELVGFAAGHPLPPDSRWWEGLRGPYRHDAALLREDGRRTFALNELMVHPAWRGRGFGRALHDALLSARREWRATLLVRPDNEPARSAYLRWGWEVVGRIQPAPDLPVFDALLRRLAAGEGTDR